MMRLQAATRSVENDQNTSISGVPLKMHGASLPYLKYSYSCGLMKVQKSKKITSHSVRK